MPLSRPDCCDGAARAARRMRDAASPLARGPGATVEGGPRLAEDAAGEAGTLMGEDGPGVGVREGRGWMVWRGGAGVRACRRSPVRPRESNVGGIRPPAGLPKSWPQRGVAGAACASSASSCAPRRWRRSSAWRAQKARPRCSSTAVRARPCRSRPPAPAPAAPAARRAAAASPGGRRRGGARRSAPQPRGIAIVDTRSAAADARSEPGDPLRRSAPGGAPAAAAPAASIARCARPARRAAGRGQRGARRAPRQGACGRARRAAANCTGSPGPGAATAVPTGVDGPFSGGPASTRPRPGAFGAPTALGVRSGARSALDRGRCDSTANF
jgi:hypothetical protein